MESNENTLDFQLQLNVSDCSVNEANAGPVLSTSPRKQLRILRPYKCIFEFNDCQSAIQKLKEPIGDAMYIFRYTRSTIEGYKDYYHCQGQQKCPKTLYILRHSDSLKASIWISSMPHAHKQTNGGSLPQKSVAHIKKMFEEKYRYTNNEIINSLRRHNCPQLTKQQINNLKARIKQQKVGPSNCCLQELIEWSQLKRAIPEDDDEIFCGGFDYLENEGELVYLRIFVTTKRLISLTKICHRDFADSNSFSLYSLLYFYFD